MAALIFGIIVGLIVEHTLQPLVKIRKLFDKNYVG